MTDTTQQEATAPPAADDTPVLVVTDGTTRLQTAASSAAPLIEKALRIAQTIDGSWAALILSDAADPAERTAALEAVARQMSKRAVLPRLPVFRELHLAARDSARGDAHFSRVHRLGRAARSASRATRGHEGLVIVLADPELERALNLDGHGPRVLDRRRGRDGLVGLSVDPVLEPRRTPPSWSENPVRLAEDALKAPDNDREREAPPTTHRLRRSAQALLGIAARHYGWAVLPVGILPPGEDAKAFERLGFKLFPALARDQLFRPARLPIGWELVAATIGGQWELAIVDEHGDPRVGVAYEPVLHGGWAAMRLIDDGHRR